MIMYMEFDWDEHNRNKSQIAHGVSWSEAEEIFANIPLILLDDTKHSQTELRHIAFGKTDDHRLLMVVFTVRAQLVRIISARDQNKKEKMYYKSQKISL